VEGFTTIVPVAVVGLVTTIFEIPQPPPPAMCIPEVKFVPIPVIDTCVTEPGCTNEGDIDRSLGKVLGVEGSTNLGIGRVALAPAGSASAGAYAGAKPPNN
jgi:hypothetical protein